MANIPILVSNVGKQFHFHKILFTCIYRSENWSDNICNLELCVGCTILSNQQFKLRGLCKSTLFDTRFKISGKADPETKRQYFIGQFGWFLKFNFTSKGKNYYNFF